MSVGYVAGNGPLHRAHPFTPLTLAAVLALLAFIAPVPWGPVLALSAAIATAVGAGVSGILRPAALTALPFWFFLLVIHWILGDPAMVAVGIAARITTIVVAFLTALAVVQPARLVDALVERGFPFSIAYVFAATLQAVPRFRDRARQVLDAQRCRGLRVGGSPVRRLRAIAPLVVPLILGALAEVDERTFALEARGAAHATRRTPLHPAMDTPRERFIRWGLVAATGIALAARIIL